MGAFADTGTLQLDNTGSAISTFARDITVDSTAVGAVFRIVGNDVTSVRSNQGFVPGGGGYTIFRDLNGDAQIVGNDVTGARSA